ncbi:MAG: hypothetical protein JNK82_09495 [Myxococcaceae bacterium]|nr:hypothetical protein [Myxococcaceae bacterium]
MITPTLIAVLLAAEGDSPATQPPPPAEEKTSEPAAATAATAGVAATTVAEQGPEEGIGGVFAPAILPRGSMAVYAMLGAPDIGGGWRQGFQRFEVEARVWLNYLQASALGEIGGKVSLYRKGILEFVPNLAVGLEANSGSRYYDKANYFYVAVRPRASLLTAIRFSEIATGLFLVDVPWAIAVTNGGAGGHFTPTMGFGAEVQLGTTLSGLLMAQGGIDVIKEPLGVTQIRPAWAIRLGLGFRLFR